MLIIGNSALVRTKYLLIFLHGFENFVGFSHSHFCVETKNTSLLLETSVSWTHYCDCVLHALTISRAVLEYSSLCLRKPVVSRSSYSIFPLTMYYESTWLEGPKFQSCSLVYWLYKLGQNTISHHDVSFKMGVMVLISRGFFFFFFLGLM